MPTITTTRLALVPWPEHHPEFVAEFQQDPRVMQYLGNGQPWDRARFEAVRAAQADQWAQHGYGWRVAVALASGALIGVATSGPVGNGVPDLDPSEHELGWWVVADAWRQGYGTEMAHAIRAEAHEVQGSQGVLARLQPENVGSARIATAIGLSYSGEILGRFGEVNALYRGTAVDWAARRSTNQSV
ncbi:MAG: GNAT family N-acetyltransferase [Solirubrobacteraceae bacterium]|nr:GNAT family N-acetyltransferase [Solirubrobacteraceae bacterium]